MEHRPFIVLPRRNPMSAIAAFWVVVTFLAAAASLARTHYQLATQTATAATLGWLLSLTHRELDRWRSAVTRAGIAVIEETS